MGNNFQKKEKKMKSSSECKKFIEDLKTQYREEIKPWIERRDYDLAAAEFHNINFILKEFARDFARYHSGINFMASSEMLEEKLRERTEPTFAIQAFEGYLSQVGLSLESENVFN
jgi:hypothetical protein